MENARKPTQKRMVSLRPMSDPKPSLRVQLLKQQIAESAAMRNRYRLPTFPRMLSEQRISFDTVTSFAQNSNATLGAWPSVPASAKNLQDRLGLLKTPPELCTVSFNSPKAPSRRALTGAKPAAKLNHTIDVKEPRTEIDGLINTLNVKVENINYAMDSVLPKILLNTVKGWKSKIPQTPSRQTILDGYLRRLIAKKWNEVSVENDALEEDKIVSIMDQVKGHFNIRKSLYGGVTKRPQQRENGQKRKGTTLQFQRRVEVIRGIKPTVKRSVMNVPRMHKRLAI